MVPHTKTKIPRALLHHGALHIDHSPAQTSSSFRDATTLSTPTSPSLPPTSTTSNTASLPSLSSPTPFPPSFLTETPLNEQTQNALTQLLVAVAFGQQLLIFNHHSTDHVGIEGGIGEYHLLLQLVIFIALIITLMGFGYPMSFLVSFVRSMSIVFMSAWHTVMGFMLWTPGLIPKECFLNLEEGCGVVRCRSDEALERAKSLANIEFSWCLVVVIVFSMCLYLYMIRIYGEKVRYSQTLSEEDEEGGDVEAQTKSKVEESKSFVQTGN